MDISGMTALQLSNSLATREISAVEVMTATLARIEVGLISEKSVEVLSGLREDDEVVVGDAARMLGPGMRVRVKDVRASAG